MLNNTEGNLQIPEDVVVNHAWHWGNAMNSTVTLPSKGSTSTQDSLPTKKQWQSSRMGISGLCEMLKVLKKTHHDQLPPPSSNTFICFSKQGVFNSWSQHYCPHPQIQIECQHAKTSIGLELTRSLQNQNQAPTSPYAIPSLTHKPSPH
jgi:hypothetical protein